jgi:hypothetical protein
MYQNGTVVIIVGYRTPVRQQARITFEDRRQVPDVAVGCCRQSRLPLSRARREDTWVQRLRFTRTATELPARSTRLAAAPRRGPRTVGRTTTARAERAPYPAVHVGPVVPPPNWDIDRSTAKLEGRVRFYRPRSQSTGFGLGTWS